MNLDDFIITCFCLIDEMMPMTIKDHQLRARGPAPKLSDSEVIMMEVVGSYLGLSQDKELFGYFQRHYTHFFPALRGLHRTTFVRQAANLWAVKERLWCWLRDTMLSYDESLGAGTRDRWHLHNRLLRCILMHTICFFFNQQDQAPYLQFDRLVA